METKNMNINIEKKWFQERQPKWLQKTAILILDKGKLSEEDYRELYKYCVNEVKNPQNEPNNDIPIEKLLNYKNTSDLIKMKPPRGKPRGITVVYRQYLCSQNNRSC